MRGSTLSASCNQTNGQQRWSSINVNGCNGDIGNNNGQLFCNSNGYNNNGYNNNGYNNGRYNNGNHYGQRRHHDRDDQNGNYNRNGQYGNGYGYNLPAGSYQQSCSNFNMNGSVLSASCTSNNGSQRATSLDLRRCPGNTDIWNHNGYLGC